MLREALKVIEAWGFTYKSIAFQWVKQNRSGNGYFFGLGRWTRGNTEPCLLAVKGKPKRISAGVGQLVFSPLRKHSQKPDEVRDRIVELMGDLPRIELFARETAPGWDSWGNEVPASSTETEENDGTAHHIRGDGISTHAPLAGRDDIAIRVQHQGIRISTHAPLAGRDPGPNGFLVALIISTHAPLAGRDH